MADTRPTKLHFFQAVYFCILAIFSPTRLIAEEEKDKELRKNYSEEVEKESNAKIVNRAFWNSLGLILLFSLIGGLIGLALRCFLGVPSSFAIALLQIIGASLLLWGTLFVRGWQIQTYCGVTLVERVNRWIYRSMYCIGTGLIICSLVWFYIYIDG